MLDHTKFQPISVQASIYTPELSQFSSSNILASILGQYADIFDGNVQAPPLPNDVPPDIPRVIVESKDNIFRIQASPARIDFLWISMRQEDQATRFNCIEVLKSFLQKISPQNPIGRLAFLITRIVDDPSPAETLIDRFCNASSKIKPLNHSENFEIHNHKRYKPDALGAEINSWVRCKAVEVIQPFHKKVIIVEQDINTLQDQIKANEFDTNFINKFFDFAKNESDQILSIYFPTDEV